VTYWFRIEKLVKSETLNKSSLYKSLLSIVNELARDNHGVINPKSLKESIAKNARQFEGYGQQVRDQ
jgi:hypothetical protein